MSDNITREPYRNAWYKQLQEEVSKIKPHLVPEVENDDNGKILVAGQEGTFDWAQPPKELPVITESDEGKVLKVDNGVPKWLEDTDSEYLFVTITRSGTSSNYTYSADKTYSEIRPFAEKGKLIAYFNNTAYFLQGIDSTHIYLKRDISINGTTFSSTTAGSAKTEYRSNNIDTTTNITIGSDNSISYIERRFYPTDNFEVTNNSTLNEFNYNYIVIAFWTSSLLYDNKILLPSKQNSSKTEFDFVNYEIGIKAHIDSSRHVTITSIPKLPVATSADEGKVLMVDANGKYTLGTVQ